LPFFCFFKKPRALATLPSISFSLLLRLFSLSFPDCRCLFPPPSLPAPNLGPGLVRSAFPCLVLVPACVPFLSLSLLQGSLFPRCPPWFFVSPAYHGPSAAAWISHYHKGHGDCPNFLVSFWLSAFPLFDVFSPLLECAREVVTLGHDDGHAANWSCFLSRPTFFFFPPLSLLPLHTPPFSPPLDWPFLI